MHLAFMITLEKISLGGEVVGFQVPKKHRTKKGFGNELELHQYEVPGN